VRPRRLAPGNAFTWRFKTKDYWQAVPAPSLIESVEELMTLHGPWVTSSPAQVLAVIRRHDGEASLDEEGLIRIELDEAKLGQANSELAELGCTLSNELLHTL
jgi:hypothetical protein